MKKRIKWSMVVMAGLTLAWVSCTKYKHVQDDLGQTSNAYIRGQLVLFDTLTGGPDTVTLRNKTVMLRYNDSASSLNFLYSAQTDSNGYFVFNDQLISSRTYFISYTDTATSGIMYQAEANAVTVGTATLLLVASPPLNGKTGIWYRFVDSASGLGPVPGVSVCIFSSNSLYSDTSCVGSTYQLVSDLEGRAFLFNTVAATYYSRININDPSLKVTKMDVFTTADTLVRKTVILP
jgi:hypothetical protein